MTISYPPTSTLVGVPLYSQFLVPEPQGSFGNIGSLTGGLEIAASP